MVPLFLLSALVSASFSKRLVRSKTALITRSYDDEKGSTPSFDFKVRLPQARQNRARSFLAYTTHTLRVYDQTECEGFEPEVAQGMYVMLFDKFGALFIKEVPTEEQLKVVYAVQKSNVDFVTSLLISKPNNLVLDTTILAYAVSQSDRIVQNQNLISILAQRLYVWMVHHTKIFFKVVSKAPNFEALMIQIVKDVCTDHKMIQEPKKLLCDSLSKELNTISMGMLICILKSMTPVLSNLHKFLRKSDTHKEALPKISEYLVLTIISNGYMQGLLVLDQFESDLRKQGFIALLKNTQLSDSCNEFVLDNCLMNEKRQAVFEMQERIKELQDEKGKKNPRSPLEPIEDTDKIRDNRIRALQNRLNKLNELNTQLRIRRLRYYVFLSPIFVIEKYNLSLIIIEYLGH